MTETTSPDANSLSQPAIARCSLDNSCSNASCQSAHLLTCLLCKQSVHLSCLVRKFKEDGHDWLRNKTDWLFDFIQYSALQYTCKNCVNQPNNNAEAGIAQSISNINQSLSNIDAKIENLYGDIKSLKCKSDDTLLITGNQLSSQNSPAIPCPSTASSKKSYAEAVSTDIFKVVQNAVSDSFKAKQLDDKINASVIIFGLPESRDDTYKVRKLLQDDDTQSIIRTYRLGKVSTGHLAANSKVTRPLRVELKSIEDRNWVLQNSRWLVRTAKETHIRITKCLGASELDKMKLLRSECAHLNKSLPKTRSGRDKLVIIDGKIMERVDDNGKLSLYKSSIDNLQLNPNLADKTKDLEPTLTHADAPNNNLLDSKHVQEDPKNE